MIKPTHNAKETERKILNSISKSAEVTQSKEVCTWLLVHKGPVDGKGVLTVS